MIIKNGLVFTEEGKFERKDIYINGKKISDVRQAYDMDIFDASSCIIIPGLTDIHVHGCHNKDFCDADIDEIHDFARYEAENGVTAICPTTMTIPEEKLIDAACAVRRYCDASGEGFEGEAYVAGINMEGPFISAGKKGSQALEDIRKPDISFINAMQRASGNRIKILDLAPELEGADELINYFKNDIVLSIAHTEADYDTAAHAIKMGMRHVTHLYNAMSPYDHRRPGVVGAVSDDSSCYAELICDGIHNHPAVVRNTFKMLGSNRIIFISDSMRATGMPDGVYEFGGHSVYVNGRKALLKDGTIAASVTNLFDCMITAVKKMGIPLEAAVKCAAVNPVKSIGLYDSFGSISPGKFANLIILDQDTFEMKKVILRGSVL